jgi:hypothetical protein
MPPTAGGRGLCSIASCGSASMVFKTGCGGVMCGVGEVGECGTVGRLG